MVSFMLRSRIFFGIIILNSFCSVPLVSSACDSPWFQSGEDCYYVSPNEQSEQVSSWHQSQSWCLQNGGYLATIEDIDERELISNATQVGSYNGAMWIGLNKLEDGINYRWTDGSTSEFRDWAVNEPDEYNNGMCVYQLTHPAQSCFTRDPGVSTIDGLFDHPRSENRPHTFDFHYLNGMNDADGSAECESRCSAEPECYSYTFISNDYKSNSTWMGECMGRSDEYNVSEPFEYAISGVRFTCGESGYWYVGNCGEKRGFICKKPVDSTTTPSPTKLPTPTVPGFCPAGYIDGGGNKCFKIVVKNYGEGVTWDTALNLCRAEPGIASDLASILSEYENSAITMYLRYEYWGFWIGLRQSDLYSDQWLWTDNQDVAYFNWASEKPSGSAKCTELWTDPGPEGTWNNLDCMQGRGYICQTYKDANSIISTPQTTPPHTCTTAYYNYGGICYRKITSGSSWSSALATCEADGATLATIHSAAENSAVYVFGSDIAPFWIGYHKNENEEWVWTDGWPDIYSNWNAEEEPGTGGGCASFKDNGKWKDDQCNSTLATICMISTATVPTTPAPVEGVCPTDWVDFGTYCYYFSTVLENQNWQMATATCGTKAGLSTAGSLASIHSVVENQFIYEQLQSRGTANAWIGLHKDAQGSPLKWIDGTELQYTRWAPGEPNDSNMTDPQLCVELYVTMWPGMWNDHLCNQYMPFVCKALKVPVVSGACDSPWFQSGEDCYYVSPNEQSEQVASWHQSESWCLQNGGYLATIEDIDERGFISNITQVGSYNGAMWIGLNKLDDGINYRWTDGSTSEFRDWAVGQPDEHSNGMCVYQLTHPAQGCFTHDPGVNTIDGLFSLPRNENRPHTFYFGYKIGMNDADGSAACEGNCSAIPECYSYTFISNDYKSNVTWMGECMGRSDEYDVSVPFQYAISGVRFNCGESGYWYVGNCGEKRGFICKKPVDSSTTPSATKLPTPTVPGFCPAGYIDGGGNKCFKIVVKNYGEGVTWDTAVNLCRAEPGIASDLASILSEYENAAITMYLRYEYWGFWIGLRQSDLYSDQWLWTDNQDVSYFNWASGRPSGSAKCTELWTDPGPEGTWNNLDCMQERGYICQTYKDANVIISTPPTTPSHTCKTDYFNYGGICYRKITSGSSWSSALATCEADGATLATIHSAAENSALYVFGRDITPFWIGYHKNENEEWVWTDGWPDIYSNWKAGEEPGTGGGCASFNNNGYWKDDQCDNNLAAICMISTATVPTTPAPVEGDCLPNWVDYGSYCYYFSEMYDTENWQMATATCGTKAGYHTTGSLASIHSAVENKFIYDQLKSRGTANAWIGLYKDARGLPLKWIDGTELQYTRWAPGEPNDSNMTDPQLCVELYVTMWPGMWNDHLCNQYMPYVCKTLKVDLPPTPTIIPPIGSCPSEYYSHAYGDYCYYMDTTKDLTFKETQEECVHKGGRHAEILMIKDIYTNLFVVEMVGKVSTYRVQIWLGLTRPHKDAEFRWIDGTQLNFTNWAPGEPNDMGNEHCGEIHSDTGVWNDMNCETNRLALICQVKRDSLPPPTVPPEPDAPDSGIYLTSGELAGIIIGTMLGMVVIIGLAFVLFGVVRGGISLPFSTAKKSDATDTASTYELPYNNYDEQPYGTLSRSSSGKSSTYASKPSQNGSSVA